MPLGTRGQTVHVILRLRRYKVFRKEMPHEAKSRVAGQLTEDRPEGTFETITFTRRQALHAPKRESLKKRSLRTSKTRSSEESSLQFNTVKTLSECPVSVPLEHGTPTVSLEIEGLSRNRMVDAGSNISILQPGVSRSDVVTSLKP